MKLEVGTVIYAQTRYDGLCRHTVSRVTPTMAFVSIREGVEIKFNREVDESYFTKKGERHSWESPTYHVATTELDEKYNRQCLVRAAEKVFSTAGKLSNDQLERIIAIAKESAA